MKNENGGILGLFLFVIIVVVFILCVNATNEQPIEGTSDISKTYYIGDTVTIKDFSVTLENCDTRKKGDSIDSYNYVADEQWVAVFLTYTNITDKEKNLYKHVRLINSSGEELERPVMYYDVWDGTILDNANLMPGGTKTGFVQFINTKIDKVSDLTLQICSNSSFSEATTYNFKLKKSN